VHVTSPAPQFFGPEDPSRPGVGLNIKRACLRIIKLGHFPNEATLGDNVVDALRKIVGTWDYKINS